MAVKPDAKVIARRDCECGERAAVFQAVNGYLYTRCDGCGCNQKRSTARQVEVWRNMEPVEGAQIVRPSNLPDYCAGPGQPFHPADKPAPKAAAQPDLKGQETEKPTEKPPQEPPANPDSGKGSGGLVWAVVGLLGIGIAGVAAAANGNR